MDFDPTITMGHIISAGAVVITLIGWGIRMQMNMKILTRQINAVVDDLAKLEKQLDALLAK